MSAFIPAPGPGESQPRKIAQNQRRSVAVLMQNSRTGVPVRACTVRYVL